MTPDEKSATLAAFLLLVLCGLMWFDVAYRRRTYQPPKDLCSWCDEGHHVHDYRTDERINGCDCDEVAAR